MATQLNNAERVYHLIRNAILAGEFRPGEHLTEERLAERTSASRTPVRHALAMLRTEGLVQTDGARGIRVRGLTAEQVRELYDLRVLLEGYGARCAASRMTEGEGAELAAVAEELAAAGQKAPPAPVDQVAWVVKKNAEFHLRIARCSGELLPVVLRSLELPLAVMSFLWHEKEDRDTSDWYHRNIVRAIERRDGSHAEALMEAHILHGRSIVMTRLVEQG